MDQVNVKPQLSQATMTPEEGSANIDKSKVAQVAPDAFIDNDQMHQLYESKKNNVTATPIVASKLQQGKSVTSVMKDDIPWYSSIEKVATEAGQMIKGITPDFITNQNRQRDINALTWKQLTGDQLSNDEQFQKEQLQVLTEKYNKDNPSDTAMGFGKGIVNSVLDLGRAAWSEKGVFGAVEGAMTAPGTAGFLLGPEVGVPTTIAAAVSGLPVAGSVSYAVDSMKQTSAETYDHLGSLTDKEGKPLKIAPDVQSQIALTTGAVTGLLNGAFAYTSLRNTPLYQRVISQGIKQAAENMALEASGKFVAQSSTSQMWAGLFKRIGTSGLIGAGVNEVSTLAKQLSSFTGEASNYKTESDLIGGVNKMLDAYKNNPAQYAKESLKAAGTGFVTGAAIHTAHELGAGAIQNLIKQSRQPFKPVTASIVGEETNPSNQPQLTSSGAPEANANPIDNLPKGPTLVSDPNITVPGPKGLDGITTQAVIKYIGDASKDTNLKRLQPEQHQQLIANIAEGAGVPYVWVNPDDIRSFANNESKAQDAKRLIIGNEDSVGSNAQVRVNTALAVEFAEKYPEASGIFTAKADGQSANDIVNYFNNIKSKQKEILGRLKADNPAQAPADSGTDVQADPNNEAQISFAPAYEKAHAEKAQKVELTHQSTDEEIKAALPYREDAQAYINHLNDQINAVPDNAPLEDLHGVLDKLKLRDRVQPLVDSHPSEIDQHSIQSQKEFTNQHLDEASPFPEELKKIIPDPDIEAINKAYDRAQTSYLESIKHASNQEMEDLIDVNHRIAQAVERETQIENYRSNPEIKIVENFLNSRNLIETDKRSFGGTKKKSYPAFSIDPKSLTEKQRELYENNPVINERKVLTKDGLPLSDVAGLLGVSDGDKLLNILANTPTQQEAVENAVKANSDENYKKSREAVEVNQQAVVKALENKVEINRQALEAYKNKDWSAYKKAIKTVALDLPKIEDVRKNAEKMIGQTRIADLNARQYRAGERRSKGKAIHDVLNGDLQNAFANKLNEIQNIENQRATLKALNSVDKRIGELAKMFTSDKRSHLINAGENFVNAVDEVFEAFDMTPYASNKEKQGAYLQLANDMATRGQGDIGFPETLIGDLDGRANWKDLTVDQFNELTDLLSNTFKLAEAKNELYQSTQKDFENKSMDVFKEAVKQQLTAHPDYDVTRGDEYLSRGVTHSFNKFIDGVESLVTNFNYITQSLDKGKEGVFGTLNDMIEGTGHYQNGIYGKSATLDLDNQFRKTLNKSIKQYGKGKFENMGVEKVYVPEFNGIVALNNGNLRKSDIFMMLLNFGEQGGRDRSTNYGVSEETILKVIQREMGAEEGRLAQNGVWNHFKSLRDRVTAIEKLDYENVELLEGVPITLGGEVFPGGYFRSMHVNEESATQKAVQELRDVVQKQEQGFDTNLAARGMTKRGYTERRTGTNNLVSLDIRNIALAATEVHNDLTMRVPLRDVAKIITNKEIRTHIINTVGRAKYHTMLDGVSSLTMTDTERRLANQIQGEHLLNRIFRSVEHAAAIKAIGFNIRSVLVQPVSVFTALEHMGGASQSKHIMSVLSDFAKPSNWKHWQEMNDFAREIDPSIVTAQQEIENHMVGGISDILPKKRLLANKSINMVAAAGNKVIHSSMVPISKADSLIKTVMALAAYRQHMAGKAPGQNMKNYYEADPQTVIREAKSYAAKINRSALTRSDNVNKANIQKNALGQTITNYWNDARSQLNTVWLTNKKIKWDYKEAISMAKAGDIEGAASKYWSGADKMAGAAVLMSLAWAWENYLIGNAGGEDDKDGPVAVTSKVIANRFGGSLPIVRDVYFAATSNQDPNTPFWRAVTDMKNAGVAVNQTLQSYAGTLDDAQAQKDLTENQWKALLATGAYGFGGLPVNGLTKIYKSVTDENAKNVRAEQLTIGSIAFVAERMKKFLFDNKDDPKMKAAVDKVEKDLKSIEQPTPYKASAYDLEVIGVLESNGGRSLYNTSSTATGKYQFIDDTWEGIVNEAPKSLHLTLNGRTNANQQERAMKWFTENNAERLTSAGYPTTLDNIYGAHHLGPRKWIKLLDANNDDPNTSVKELIKNNILSTNAINGNPWMQGLHTVGELIRANKGRVSKAERQVLLP